MDGEIIANAPHILSVVDKLGAVGAMFIMVAYLAFTNKKQHEVSEKLVNVVADIKVGLNQNFHNMAEQLNELKKQGEMATIITAEKQRTEDKVRELIQEEIKLVRQEVQEISRRIHKLEGKNER